MELDLLFQIIVPQPFYASELVRVAFAPFVIYPLAVKRVYAD